MTSIYLAGGMHGDWRSDVRDDVGAIFYDPSDYQLDSLEEFGTWDLHHVKQADVVFTYIERDNPSCIGAAVETGYAAGQGTTVVLVLEPDHEHFKDRYLDFFKKVADVTYESLDEGIQYLKTFS